VNSTTILATRSNHGVSLNEVDLQNVALHELGHSLGLGHSNHTGDLMYGTYSIGTTPESISTLDVYGVPLFLLGAQILPIFTQLMAG